MMRVAGAVLLLGIACGNLYAATVRGRLLHTVAGRSVPAGGLSVALANRAGKRSFAVVSDDRGMFLFQGISAGAYTLQIWNSQGSSPLTYPITVQEPILDIPPLNLP